MAFGQQLLIYLWPKTVNQHHFHAHALDQRQVLHQAGQLTRSNGFTGNGHHKGFASVHMDVGRDRAEPRNESEIEDSGHGWVSLRLEQNQLV